MSASFPTNVKTWSPLHETYPRNLETVRAFHVTDTYFEITAIEQELGTGGLRTSVVDNATAFIPPKPYNSWILNEETALWEAPVPYPDKTKIYDWEENSISWKIVELSS